MAIAAKGLKVFGEDSSSWLYENSIISYSCGAESTSNESLIIIQKCSLMADLMTLHTARSS